MHVSFSHQEHLADEIHTFYFKPDTKITYLAGQFTELTLPHHSPDDRGKKRWFTLTSSPTEDMLAITTKIPKNPSTFKQALIELKPNQSVHMAEPMGDFVLPIDQSVPVLFVAGGIGITPVRSIVKSLTDTGDNREISLLYSAKRASEFVFKDVFAAYNMDTDYIDTSQQNKKNISASDITKRIKKLGTRVYISGPEQMVEQLMSDLEAEGIYKHLLIGDYFPGYPDSSGL